MGRTVTASLDQMSALGNYMISMSEEFKLITDKMDEIVGQLENGWSGQDASIFIANAQTYIANLKQVENKMATLGSVVLSYAVKYNNMLAKYFEIIG